MTLSTTAEKILSEKAGKRVKAGELVVVPTDGIMASDTTAPGAIQAFEKMGGDSLWDPSRCFFVIDHAAPAPNERIANLHQLIRSFATQQKARLFDIGEGICHQIMVENQYVKPGDLFIGADSHTPTYGALNAMACGVGSTDLAAVMLTGKIWLKVPHSIRIHCRGKLNNGVFAKDLILYLTKKIGISGATYQSVEFEGEAFTNMSLASRLCIANMSAEMGAKTCFVHAEGLTLPYPYQPIFPDQGAHYSKELEIDVSTLEPMIAYPESPDEVFPLKSVEGTPVQYGFIGTCGNGRLEDLQAAAHVLRGKKIAAGTRLLIAPASRKVLLDAMLDGTAYQLVEAGATLITPGCGPCVGSHEGVPADGEIVISAANRNFKGRMGNPHARIFLSAPQTVAASVLHGFITSAEESF